MNRAEKEARRKQLKEQSRLRKQKKVQERDLLDELQEDMDEDQLLAASDQPLAEESKTETVEKDYGYYPGPTSFEELDAMDAAREQASQINRVSWNTSDLVYNIIGSPVMTPKEKSQAIKKVGDGFEKRVSSILSGEAVKKDLDLLSIEAVLAHDARQTGMVEKALDWINKKTLSGSALEKLSEADFALPEKRKYPIHDKTHVRKALFEAAGQIRVGGEAADEAKAALPKIRAAAKQFGIEMDTQKEKSGILIEKDASGSWRWVGWCSNKFKDWDGEIMEEAAHKEYIGWLDANPDMSPVFMSWHTPETVRESPVDFWMYEHGFLIMSGALTEGEAEGLMSVQKEADLGMSHGSFVLKRDPNNRKVIKKYRMYEVSDLPLENAANPFTNFETVVKEAGMDKKQYFAGLFGAEKAEKYLAMTKEAEQSLEDAGVQSKEKKAEGQQAEAPAQVPAAPVTPAPAVASPSKLTPADLEAIAKAVGDKYGMEQLNAYLGELQAQAEKVPVLEELVKALAEGQDEALAEAINPPAGSFVWMQKSRASQAESTRLNKNDETDEKLKKSIPTFTDADFIAQQTGIAPIRASS